jgi:hypothetical protein
MNKFLACMSPHLASFSNKWQNIIEDVIIEIKVKAEV